jgi:ubiquitin carboxyl-terminal hydrolase 4/11/15
VTQLPRYCPSCEKHQQATKKFDLWSLPEVLVIHLKRFSYNRYWRDKIDTVIDFPVKVSLRSGRHTAPQGLDMTQYVINSMHGQAIYDLLAVSNHYGGMGGGHCKTLVLLPPLLASPDTAYGKNKLDGNWYYFDDSSVTQTNEEAVVTKAAYVLFYQRRYHSLIRPPDPSPPLGHRPRAPACRSGRCRRQRARPRRRLPPTASPTA